MRHGSLSRVKGGVAVPVSRFAMILIAVLAAAGVTVWGLSLLGPQALAIALPLALIAAAAVQRVRR